MLMVSEFLNLEVSLKISKSICTNVHTEEGQGVIKILTLRNGNSFQDCSAW